MGIYLEYRNRRGRRQPGETSRDQAFVKPSWL